jgi:hypothetical protein
MLYFILSEQFFCQVPFLQVFDSLGFIRELSRFVGATNREAEKRATSEKRVIQRSGFQKSQTLASRLFRLFSWPTCWIIPLEQQIRTFKALECRYCLSTTNSGASKQDCISLQGRFPRIPHLEHFSFMSLHSLRMRSRVCIRRV